MFNKVFVACPAVIGGEGLENWLYDSVFPLLEENNTINWKDDTFNV